MNSNYETAKKVGSAIGFIVADAIISLIAFLTYTEIASIFNLPPINFWSVAGVVITFRYLIKPKSEITVTLKNEEEKKEE